MRGIREEKPTTESFGSKDIIIFQLLFQDDLYKSESRTLEFKIGLCID